MAATEEESLKLRVDSVGSIELLQMAGQPVGLPPDAHSVDENVFADEPKSNEHSGELRNCASDPAEWMKQPLIIQKNGHVVDYADVGTISSQSSCRQILLDEVVPCNSTIDINKLDEENVEANAIRSFWSLETFTSKFRGKKKEDKKLPRRIRRYYKDQDELIRCFKTSISDNDDDGAIDDKRRKMERTAGILAKASLVLNIVLLAAKLAAAILSNSLSVISSLVDSIVDLISGIVIWYTSRAVKKRNHYSYPQGRTRLEPVSIMILSAIMSVASVQLIGQSIQTTVTMVGLPGQEGAPVMDIPTIVILVFTIVSKLVLFLVCQRWKSPLSEALAQDHRNDVLSNIVALVCGYIAFKLWKYADPIGAIVISVYIFITWWATGLKQIKMLTGYTAQPDFLKRVTWLCLHHHDDIRYIDTVRAFHFGTNFLVEVDIVLPEGMSLKDAHDIGEPLQQKIEKLPNVERCFVHLDYEVEHDPTKEHKVV
ncbi:uncharacterized protein LOC141908619 [Tubulanus polymorphus]|uniref:uncharacterized protein LOC141908619 n=1 Tax=Tubulanus polymorphus TaxID=672921 RepID=UPI003DA5C712